MSTDIILDEGKYISSKRASEMTGYAQDYIGQLCRGSLIDARRIGGLWYVSMDSLLAYQNRSEDTKPKPPVEHTTNFPDADSFTHLDGKEYISANRASKVTGYNQDYVGQLARGGKVSSRQIGNRWYVEKDALLAHKAEKDALLAAVQVQSVGIIDRSPIAAASSNPAVAHDPLLTYTTDEGDLLPEIEPEDSVNEEISQDEQHMVPIRVIERTYAPAPTHVEPLRGVERHERAVPHKIPGKSMNRAIYPVVALTIVVVISLGFVTLKTGSLYTFGGTPQGTAPGGQSGASRSATLVANASQSFESVVSAVEELLAKELVYRRGE